MPSLRKPTPSYLFHRQSGRGRIVWYDVAGVRRQKLLPGTYNSTESRTAFGRMLLELESSSAPPIPVGKGVSLAELLLAYLDHAEKHYRGPDGRPTSEVYEVRVVIRAVRELYADTLASDFGPIALKAARQRWVNEGRSRTECNRRVGMVKRIFKWAVSEQLVPAAVYQALVTVEGLRQGKTLAHETKPVKPVDDAIVDATLPFLNHQVRGLVEFQRLTGCRPGEACALRLCDIERRGAVWLYRPAHHKNAWRGQDRVIAIGPKAQQLLTPYFSDDPSAPLFSPAKAVEELRANRSISRKTKRYPTQMARSVAKRKKNPRRSPNIAYKTQSYEVAIDRACDRAFPPPAPLARRDDETRSTWKRRLTEAQCKELQSWRRSHRWNPNQLRHTYATKVRELHGLEAAQVVLGHARIDTTEIYAERNEKLSVSVAQKLG